MSTFSNNTNMIRLFRTGSGMTMCSRQARSLITSTVGAAALVDPAVSIDPGKSPPRDADIDVDSSRREAVKIHSSLSSWSPSKSSSSLGPDGFIDYGRSWAWQQTLLSHRMALRRRSESSEEVGSLNQTVRNKGDHDSVLLLEHKPVYTLGRGADENHLTFLYEDANAKYQDARDRLSRKALPSSSRGDTTTKSARLVMDRRFDLNSTLTKPLEIVVDSLSHIADPVIAPNGVPIYRVDRGGEVTFHGPSQLVVYPLLDLKRPPFQKDLHWYLRMVEEVVIQTLKHYDIESQRDENNTGVWVGDNKIAAVGVSASRWITTHGFALNVSPDLSYFDTSVILPCGIEGKGVTSMEHELKQRDGAGAKIPLVDDVAVVVLDVMKRIFGIHFESGDYLS